MPSPSIRQPSPHQSPATPVGRPFGAGAPTPPGFPNGTLSNHVDYDYNSTSVDYDPRMHDPSTPTGSQYSEGKLGRNPSVASNYTGAINYPQPNAGIHYEDEEYEDQNDHLYRSNSQASKASLSRSSIRTSHSSATPHTARTETLSPQATYITASTSYRRPSYEASHSGPSNRHNELDRIAAIKGPLGLHEESDDEFLGDDSDEEDDSRFVNLALLSHLAVRLRDRVPRGTHVKGSIPYPRAFTGKDIVSTIQSQIQRELSMTMGLSHK